METIRCLLEDRERTQKEDRAKRENGRMETRSDRHQARSNERQRKGGGWMRSDSYVTFGFDKQNQHSAGPSSRCLAAPLRAGFDFWGHSRMKCCTRTIDIERASKMGGSELAIAENEGDRRGEKTSGSRGRERTPGSLQILQT
jgi:hypothetical protein